MFLLASFISGSIVTGLVTFIGMYYTKKRDPLKTQRALVETNIIRDKMLELTSSKFANNSEKALMICSVEQVPVPTKKSISQFLDEYNEFKDEVQKMRNRFEGYDKEVYKVEYYVNMLDESMVSSEKKIIGTFMDVSELQEMITTRRYENYFSKSSLYEILRSFNKHVQAVDEKIKNKKTTEELNRIYAKLVNDYDPYYYLSATRLKSRFKETGSENDFLRFGNECLRLLDLNQEIMVLVSETAKKAEIEPGLNLLDVNLIHGWLAEIGNKNYMSEKNPLMVFNDDWQEFDSKRKELARKRGKAQIWALEKLSSKE